MTDDELIEALAEELAETGDLVMTLSPAHAFGLAGIIQLAMRHPQLPAHVRETAIAILRTIRTHFGTGPAVRAAVLEVLRRGDDPGEDR
jgi:hypothetical protein